MLKQFIIAACLAAVYTTHCAHAAVDFKNKAADPVTCSTQNHLLQPQMYKSGSLQGDLILRLESSWGTPEFCRYKLTGNPNDGCSQNSVSCVLELDNNNIKYCKANLSSDTASDGTFTFNTFKAPAVDDYTVTAAQWLPPSTITPDIQLYADNNSPETEGDMIIATLNVVTTEVDFSDLTPGSHLPCRQSICQSSLGPQYGDTITYAISNPQGQIKNCSGVYINIGTSTNQQWGVSWNPKQNCFSGTSPLVPASDPQLNKKNYNMIDLSNMINKIKKDGNSLDSVKLNNMELTVHKQDKITGGSASQLFLYTNHLQTFLIPHADMSTTGVYWTCDSQE